MKNSISCIISIFLLSNCQTVSENSTSNNAETDPVELLKQYSQTTPEQFILSNTKKAANILGCISTEPELIASLNKLEAAIDICQPQDDGNIERLTSKISYMDDQLAVMTFSASMWDYYSKSFFAVFKNQNREWVWLGGELYDGFFLNAVDLDGDLTKEIIVNDQKYYSSGKEGKYVVYTTKELQVYYVGEFGSYKFYEGPGGNTIRVELKQDSIILKTQITTRNEDFSLSFENKIDSYTFPEFLELLKSNPPNYDDYWTWLQGNIGDFRVVSGKARPRPLSIKWSFFLKNTGYAPVGVSEKSGEFIYDIALFEKVSDYGGQAYYFMLAVYKDGKLVSENVILEEDNKDCDVDVSLLWDQNIRKIEVFRDPCDNWEIICLSNEANLVRISSTDTVSYEKLVQHITYFVPLPKAYFNNHNIKYIDENHINSFRALGETDHFLIGILQIALEEIRMPVFYLCSFSKERGLLTSVVDLGYYTETSEPASVHNLSDDITELLVVNKKYEWTFVVDGYVKGKMIDSTAVEYKLDSIGVFSDISN